MFNIDTLKTNLFGMVGLKDSDNPDLPLNTITASSQSVYFDDYHPLVTFDNIYWIAPNYDGMNYTNWTATAYASGSYVMYDNIAYRARAANGAGVVPSKTSTVWTSPVNDWITEKENAAINKLCNDLFTSKKLNEGSKTFLDSVQVIDGSSRQDDTVTASSRFVGFEIKILRTNNIKAVINYIGLHFTSIQTNLDIYLFHTSQKTAVGKWTLTSAAATSFDWIDASSPGAGSNELHYVKYSSNIDSGGMYYIGYFEDDISGSAIEKEVSCGCSYPDAVFKWSRWAAIRPIEVLSGDLDGYNIFDIDKISYSDTNYGLNLSFSIKTDITEMLVNNKALFVTALGYQFANDMLQTMIYNAENRMAAMQNNATRNAVLYEWSAPENQNSIKQKLSDAIEALSYDLSRISQVLPDRDNRMKLRVGAM